MKTELYIAHRLSLRHGGAKAGIMERVATIATAISMAVIIVTLAVVVGFKESLDNLISGASADITITSPASRGVVSGALLESSAEIEALLEDDRIERYSAYTAKEGVLKSDDNIAGVLLKGVDQSYNFDFFAEHIIEGELPRIGNEPRSKDILISSHIAQSMDVVVGDRMEMVFIDNRGDVMRDRFAICGIYDTGLDIVDRSYVLTDMLNVARLYTGNSHEITGYELWLKPDVDAETFAAELNDTLTNLYLFEGINAEAFTLTSIFPDIFGWLNTHNVNATAIVIIMIVVALLNMTTSLLILVLERQRMIGELRSMGMTRWGVVKLFLFRALNILLRGMIWGSIMGIALTTIEHLWGIVPLPEGGYLLDSVPASLCWGWWAIAIAGAFVISIVVLMLPATFAASISPSRAMRYE